MKKSSPAHVRQPLTPSFGAVIEAARAGGAWALEILFRDFQPPLLRYLRGQAPELADDVASETWIAVARELEDFEGDPSDFQAWLLTVARDRLIDERRSASRRVETSGLSTTEIIDVCGLDLVGSNAGLIEAMSAAAVAGPLSPVASTPRRRLRYFFQFSK